MAVIRVRNLTRGYSVKLNQALRAVENCAAAWVEFGVSIRDLNVAESIAARLQQSKAREPLPFAELPGLIFERPGHERELYAERQGVMEANQFAKFQAAGT